MEASSRTLPRLKLFGLGSRRCRGAPFNYETLTGITRPSVDVDPLVCQDHLNFLSTRTCSPPQSSSGVFQEFGTCGILVVSTPSTILRLSASHRFPIVGTFGVDSSILKLTEPLYTESLEAMLGEKGYRSFKRCEAKQAPCLGKFLLVSLCATAIVDHFLQSQCSFVVKTGTIFLTVSAATR